MGFHGTGSGGNNAVMVAIDDQPVWKGSDRSKELVEEIDASLPVHFIQMALIENGDFEYHRIMIFLTGESPGDVNLDCALNILDVIRVLNHVSGATSLDDSLFDVADYNDDNGIDVLDLVAMTASILEDFGE